MNRWTVAHSMGVLAAITSITMMINEIELHILENAPHGSGMGGNNDQTVKEWPDQALRFMVRQVDTGGWLRGS